MFCCFSHLEIEQAVHITYYVILNKYDKMYVF